MLRFPRFPWHLCAAASVSAVPALCATAAALLFGSLAAPAAHAQDLFIANFGDGTVKRVGSGGGVATTFALGFNNPIGLAFDSSGRLYVEDGNTVSRVGAGGGAAALFSSGYNGPTGLAFDANGNLYTADGNGSTISRVGPGGGTATTFATGLSSPLGLAFSPVIAAVGAPEPGTFALLGTGLMSMGGIVVRRRYCKASRPTV